MIRVDHIGAPARAVAGPLFITVFVLEGARRPDYKPLRHPVSSLALGSEGWVQVANFAVAGTLCLVGAAGLLRTPDSVLGTRLGPALFGGVGIAAGFNQAPRLVNVAGLLQRAAIVTGFGWLTALSIRALVS
jgi:hypothetical protein